MVPNCPTCGMPLWDPTCPKCANNTFKQQKAALANAPIVRVVVWQIDGTQKGKIVGQSLGPFKDKLQDYIGAVMTCITDHQGDTEPTVRDEEDTIWDGGNTLTVDFQGTRMGSDGRTLWIDIQGQWGSKKTGRKSYFQIMVKCGAGMPGRAIIQQAILDSLKSENRSVVHDGGPDRPVVGS